MLLVIFGKCRCLYFASLDRSAKQPQFKHSERYYVCISRLRKGKDYHAAPFNLILAPVPPFSTHLFLYPSILPLLIHHSVHLQLPPFFTSGLKPTSFTNPTPVVSLLSPGLPSRTIACTVSSELFGFVFIFFLIFSLLCRALH